MVKRYILKLSARGGLLTREPFDKARCLRQLQRAVGGPIERAPTVMPVEFIGVDCFINEQGMLHEIKVVNSVLTLLCRLPIHAYIVGDAVFAVRDGMGRTFGLTEERCAALEQYLVRLGAIKAEDFGKIKED